MPVPRRDFRSYQRLLEHAASHGADLGYNSEHDYLEAARRLFDLESGVQIVERSTGERLFFSDGTGEFGIPESDDATISSYFRPDSPRRYWQKQWMDAIAGGGKWIKQ